MKDSVRRILLFTVILIAGLVLVLFDLPAIFLVLVVIALAVLVLLINGSIKIPKLKVPKISFSSKKGEKKSVKEQKPPVTTKPAKEKSGKKPGSGTKTATDKKPGKKTQGRFSTIRDAFSSMGQAFTVIAGDIGKARKPATAKQRDKNKLDQMLDQSVQGRAPDIRSLKEANPEIIPSGKQSVSDPFSTLVKEQMNTELLDSVGPDDDMGDLSSLNDLDLGADMSGAFGDDISNLDISLDTDEGITIDDDSDNDEVASILAANMGDLDPGDEGEKDPLSGEMDMGGLEDLDVNSIDLDQELGDPDNPDNTESRTSPPPDKSPPASAPKPASSSASPMGGSPFASAPSSKMDTPEKPKDMSDSMMAFSSGKGMDDDLMASLKSDASGVKKDTNAPLLRDLKDVKVPAADLEKELEGILSMTKVKK
ncbi:MAG: hypothetical protein WCJ93_11575 [Methanomicrobiales archaeon]